MGEPLVVAAAWFSWRAANVRVVADEEGVTIVNYTKTVRHPWRDIDEFDVGGGYYGIEARLWDGRVERINAIQKSNAAQWLNQETRADRVVSELNSLLRTHVGVDERGLQWLSLNRN